MVVARAPARASKQAGATNSSKSKPGRPISTPTTSASVLETTLRHFGAHQKRIVESASSPQAYSVSQRQNVATVQNSNAEARAQLLYRDLNAFRVPSTQDENATPSSTTSQSSLDNNTYYKQVIEAVLHCVDSAVEALAQSTKASNEASLAANCTLELAAAVGIVFLAEEDGALEDEDESENSASIVNALFERAALATIASNDWVRIVGCRLYGFCLKQIGKFASDHLEAESVTEGASPAQQTVLNLCESAAESLVPRCTDKSQAVRNVAIRVSRYGFLAEPLRSVSTGEGINAVLPPPEDYFFYSDDLEDSLGNAMAHDSSYANRAAATSAIPLHQDSLLLLVDRVRDVKVKVRTEALSVLKDDAPFEALTTEQQIDILSSGLTDRCAQTKQTTMELLCCNWLKTLKFHPCALIDMLDPTLNEDVCEKTILAIQNAVMKESNTVLRELSGNEIQELRTNLDLPLQREISTLSLTPASALYIRVRAAHIMASGDRIAEELVSKIVPDMVSLSIALQKHLGEYLESIGRMAEHQDDEEAIEKEDNIQDAQSFICSQILRLAQACQSAQGDEAGRRQLGSLVRSILCSSDGDDDLVEPCVRTLASLSTNEESFFQDVAEILNEVRKWSIISRPGGFIHLLFYLFLIFNFLCCVDAMLLLDQQGGFGGL
jgi:hypothetical protein